MIASNARLGLASVGDQPKATQFAAILQDFYHGLLEQGVPDSLAALVRRLERSPHHGTDSRQLALVVEGDPESRALAAALLGETNLAVIECASAEAALAALQQRGAEVAFVFVDQHLAGPRDGFALARSVATLWPKARIVLTTDGHERPANLPTEVVTLPKPWRGLDLIMEARRAF